MNEGGASVPRADVSGLTLHLREIATALPSTDEAASIAPADPEALETWHDSTLQLERGLDVVELVVESPQAGPTPRA
jgi:hypothetical protein